MQYTSYSIVDLQEEVGISHDVEWTLSVPCATDSKPRRVSTGPWSK
jgi:hypothetical protein